MLWRIGEGKLLNVCRFNFFYCVLAGRYGVFNRFMPDTIEAARLRVLSGGSLFYLSKLTVTWFYG